MSGAPYAFCVNAQLCQFREGVAARELSASQELDLKVFGAVRDISVVGKAVTLVGIVSADAAVMGDPHKKPKTSTRGRSA